MADDPRFFPSDWRERLDGHAALGWFNVDEREILQEIVSSGEAAWGIEVDRAAELLACHVPLPPGVPQTFESLERRAQLVKDGVGLKEANGRIAEAASRGQHDPLTPLTPKSSQPDEEGDPGPVREILVRALGWLGVR